jgi:hypothetical protein
VDLVANRFCIHLVAPLQGSFGHGLQLRPLCLGCTSTHQTASDGFTKKYNCTKLVHAEPFPRPRDAIEREKQLKNWNRDWKLDLIREHNPSLDDLYHTL